MSKKRVILFLIIAVLIVLGVLYGPRLARYTQKARARQDFAQQEKLLADSKFTWSWVRTLIDSDPRIIKGQNSVSDLLVKWELTFTTTDTPVQVIQAYKTYAMKQKWNVDSETLLSSGTTVMSIDLDEPGALTIRVTPGGDSTTVDLERRIAP